MALAFYYGGRLVREYSTLDIAGTPDSVEASESHYRVIDRVEGYRWKENNFYTFEVVGADGRQLVFDPTTGEILSAQRSSKGR
jgi:hypothetical protein